MRLIVCSSLRCSPVAGCDRQKAEAPASACAPKRRAGQGRRSQPQGRGRRPTRQVQRSRRRRHRPGRIPRACRCWSICGRPGARRASRSCRRSQKLAEAQADGRQAGRDRGQPGHGAARRRSMPSSAKRDIGRFAAYHDPDMGLSIALSVQIMPTTSSTTRRATKCGAMSAISTGPARKRQAAGRGRRQRLAAKPEQPPVDRREARARSAPGRRTRRGASCSPRNSAPSRIAIGGTRRVTSSALVAPAESISRK